MRCYHPAVAGLAALLGTSSVAAQTSPGPCGEVVTVQRGDTLSRIAERCNVTERSLIRVNPWIDGSHDLRVGMQIRTQGGAGSSGGAVDRLGSLAGEAVDTLSGLARDVGSSAQDLLDRNPDLRQRLEGFGQRLSGTPNGAEQNRPAVQGTVSVTPMELAAGSSANVTAQGLPQNVPVVIGAGAPQAAYEVLERARTGADGRLQMNVRMPDWAANVSRLVVVVAAEDGTWTTRSVPAQITGGRP